MADRQTHYDSDEDTAVVGHNGKHQHVREEDIQSVDKSEYEARLDLLHRSQPVGCTSVSFAIQLRWAAHAFIVRSGKPLLVQLTPVHAQPLMEQR